MENKEVSNQGGGTQEQVNANKTNQCNPTHTPSGPGRDSGYTGAGTKADLDNHANQKNPNNPEFKGGDSTKK